MNTTICLKAAEKSKKKVAIIDQFRPPRPHLADEVRNLPVLRNIVGLVSGHSIKSLLETLVSGWQGRPPSAETISAAAVHDDVAVENEILSVRSASCC